MRQMSWPFQLGTQASPPICGDDERADPGFHRLRDRVRRRIDHGDGVPRICGTQILPPTTSGSPSAVLPRAGSSRRRRSSRGSIRARPVGVVTQTASGRGGRPAGATVTGSSRSPCSSRDRLGSRRRSRSPRSSRTPRRRLSPGQRPAGDDPVPGGIDALELALAVGGRPGRAVGERGVVGRAADRDRLQALAGRDRDAADRGRARVLHPHRACAVAEATGAEADAGLRRRPCWSSG